MPKYYRTVQYTPHADGDGISHISQAFVRDNGGGGWEGGRMCGRGVVVKLLEYTFER